MKLVARLARFIGKAWLLSLTIILLLLSKINSAGIENSNFATRSLFLLSRR